ncbi:hypothetical protein BDY19DRAFT_996058 [Irpex rosettiformis]|uniref:Uncharacterized protein n=1 Tax=Irpex rosettiformis TaxID=378272 RepID=A0ACB8TW30_9APHY|nr:hypothetical protein BDY19DRAFT_996058 [Irpex rosettiformis]
MEDIQLDNEHPFVLELASLREAASRYEHEALAASVKLQRHTVDTTSIIEHSHALEQENARLREELETLRAHPDTTPQPAALQVPELTLALRKLSDKLTSTEETLLLRTTQLAHAQSELGKVEQDKATVLATARHAGTRLEESEHRERELHRRVRAAKEERKLADMVLEEYAALVRKLEGRPSGRSSAEGENGRPSPAAGFAEGKLVLQKLLGEFNAENEQVASELGRTRSENELLHAQLDAERQRSEADRESLAKMILELDKYRADDNSAAKMVSRYMKFSQSTTDSLQKAMDNMRTRHETTISTLHSQIEQLHKALTSERRQTERLREALDQLSEDISREAYGRRREISLRLSFLGREEGLAESLRRWLRKSKETSDRIFSQATELEDPIGALRETTSKILQMAEGLLEALNGQPGVDEGVPVGSVARIVAAGDAVNRLTRELQRETHLRVQAQVLLGQAGINFQIPPSLSHPQELLLTPSQSTSSVNLRDSLTKLTGTVRSSSNSSTESNVSALIPQPATPEQPVTASIPNGSYATNDLPHAEEKAVTPPPQSTPATQDSPIPVDSDIESTSQPSDDLPSNQLPSEKDEIPQLEGVSPNSGVSSISPPSPVAEPKATFSEPKPSVLLPIVSITSVVEHAAFSSINTVQISEEREKQSPASSHGSILDCPPAEEPPSSISPEQVSVSPIRELSGLDIRDLPSSSQSSPQLPDPAEHTSNTSSTLVASLNIETRAATPTGMLFTLIPVVPPSTIPLMADLQITKQRYDAFQKAFRDCNLSLKELKKDVAELPSSSEMTPILKTAVERLNDFNEDTRVELEIRVADEERIISGYETILSVPGALSDEVDESELREETSAFVEGTAASVAKALQQFTRKLDDLEHDIASIKRAVHELSSEELSPSSVSPAKSPQGWSSWTGGILGGARPVSPAPTFGSVMTTPRARQSSFGAFMHRPSLPNLHTSNAVDSVDRNNPFAHLDLRIPMPAVTIPQNSPSPSRGLFLSPAPGGSQQKSRAASSPMYMLGLGMRGSSLGFGSLSSAMVAPSKLSRSSEDESEVETEDGDGAAVDSDVE